jgi:hypothetical protein
MLASTQQLGKILGVLESAGVVVAVLLMFCMGCKQSTLIEGHISLTNEGQMADTEILVIEETGVKQLLSIAQ